MSKIAAKLMIEDESPEFIAGFKRAAEFFAYWKDGVRYCGTYGTTLKEVFEAIDEEIENERV